MTDDPPDHDAVIIMAHHDAMPKRWRELVHEYGFARVWAFKDNGMSFDDAEFNSEVAQMNKQNEWLATNYTISWKFNDGMEGENEVRRRAAGLKKR